MQIYSFERSNQFMNMFFLFIFFFQNKLNTFSKNKKEFQTSTSLFSIKFELSFFKPFLQFSTSKHKCFESNEWNNFTNTLMSTGLIEFFYLIRILYLELKYV